jgi:CRISPR-associated protein Csx14
MHPVNVRNSQSSHKNILVALLGRTPQVLTEALYALCVECAVAIREVWAISTQEGFEVAAEKLFEPREGRFYRMQRDYPQRCGNIVFTPEQILVAQDGLLPVPDIRNRADSESFLELILRVLWEKTADPGTALHCSLAGGRKTMSTYMAIAMQMLGREQDRLYHVLLTPQEAENHPEFYYPTSTSRKLQLNDGQSFDSSRVKVELVEIPFVRLRERMPAELLAQRASFSELQQWTQEQINALPRMQLLTLIPSRQLLRIGGRELALPPIEFCLYWHFAERTRNRPAGIPRECYNRYFEKPDGVYLHPVSVDKLQHKHRLISRSDGMARRFAASLERDRGLTFDRVLQYISKINRKLAAVFADLEAYDLYRISAVGTYGKCYGLKIDATLIRVED